MICWNDSTTILYLVNITNTVYKRENLQRESRAVVEVCKISMKGTGQTTPPVSGTTGAWYANSPSENFIKK